MILADKITEERKKNGWSQEELAEKLGVSRQAVSKWESAGATPDLQRVILMANLFEVSTDYLLMDELEPDNAPVVSAQSDSHTSLRRVSMEEANDFLRLKRKDAPTIANATSLCILSPVLLIVLASLSESGLFSVSEGLAAALGFTVLLGLVAAAVFLFITCGIRESHSEHLEKETFETEYGVTGMVKEKASAFEGSFSSGIAVGVVLCIIAVIPVVLAGALGAPDYISGSFVGVLLLLIAVGVNLIIRVSIIKGSYDTLLQKGEYTRAEKSLKNKMDSLSGIYWCLVTAIYLGWSFWTMRWDFTWIIWPVAAVLFAVFYNVMRVVLKADEN